MFNGIHYSVKETKTFIVDNINPEDKQYCFNSLLSDIHQHYNYTVSLKSNLDCESGIRRIYYYNSEIGRGEFTDGQLRVTINDKELKTLIDLFNKFDYLKEQVSLKY